MGTDSDTALTRRGPRIQSADARVCDKRGGVDDVADEDADADADDEDADDEDEDDEDEDNEDADAEDDDDDDDDDSSPCVITMD